MSLSLCVCSIEKFTVKAWPQAQWGKFYKGDSYIVLHVRAPASSS